MLTDADIKALTPDINTRNVLHMLVDDLKKAQALAMDPRNLDPVFEFYDANKMVSPRHERALKLQRTLTEGLKSANDRVESLKLTLHAAELQLHDDQTLREDYQEAVRELTDTKAAYENLKAAALRDEETIKELKAKVKAPAEKSETFREVRDERDKALKKLEAIAELATYGEGDSPGHISLAHAIQQVLK